MLIRSTKPVLLQVIYYMPSHPTILQEFTWGYEDLVPELVRTHRFLHHWKTNIQAVISEVMLSVADGHHRHWRSADSIIDFN